LLCLFVKILLLIVENLFLSTQKTIIELLYRYFRHLNPCEKKYFLSSFQSISAWALSPLIAAFLIESVMSRRQILRVTILFHLGFARTPTYTYIYIYLWYFYLLIKPPRLRVLSFVAGEDDPTVCGNHFVPPFVICRKPFSWYSTFSVSSRGNIFPDLMFSGVSFLYCFSLKMYDVVCATLTKVCL